METLAVALGDSLTYGYPHGPQASWVGIASKLTGKRLINAGQNGATAPDLINAFCSRVLPHQPAYVIIGTGTNEALRGQTTSRFAQDMETLQELARAHHIIPVIILPIPLLSKEERRLKEFRNLIQRQPCAQLDFYSPFLDPVTRRADPSWYSDLVHPTLMGYRRLTQALLSSGTIKELTSHDGRDPGK